MKSRLLVHFMAVYAHGSISAASKVLHITQPALTKSIRQLEGSLQVTLFDRTPKGLTPTRFGHLLARHGRTIHLEVDHAMAELRMLRDGLGGRITIGAGALWMERYLPEVIAELNRRRPALLIQTLGGVRHTLMPALINGSIDVACLMLDGPHDEGIVKRPLFDVHHVLVARKQHPLAGGGAFKMDRLAEFPWAVLRDDEVAGGRLAAFLSAQGLPPPVIATESTSIMAMLRVVEKGDFLAHVLDRFLPLLDSFGIVRLPFEHDFWSGSAGIAYRALPEPSFEVQAFLEIIDEMAPRWL